MLKSLCNIFSSNFRNNFNLLGFIIFTCLDKSYPILVKNSKSILLAIKIIVFTITKRHH